MSDQHDREQHESGVSRRRFITTAAAAGAGTAFMIVPRHVLGRGMQAPSDLVNVAAVGINGQGGTNTAAVMSQNIVALCDVDSALLDNRLNSWTGAAGGRGGGAAGAGRGGGGRGGGGRGAAAAAGAPAGAATAAGQRGGGGRAGGAGQGRQGGAAAGTSELQWQTWDSSKEQEAADARFPREEPSAGRQKFAAEAARIQKYADYRVMLDKQKNIDAVIIATPDHMHAVIASAAMDLGKHVYVQKPMAWSVHETRHLTKRAAEMKVQAQCGNQRHSSDTQRRGVEYILSGVIGNVTHVHVWTNRPIWPQGIGRPVPYTGDAIRTGHPSRFQHVVDVGMGAIAGDFKPPATLNWDLFLGVAKENPYHPIYHPFNWRGFVDYGQGALGDMGAHLIDFPVWALNLDPPTVIETMSTPFNDFTFPLATMTHYDFAAKGSRPALRMTWYDGGFKPPVPEELGPNGELSQSGGILYIGTKGKLLHQEGGPPRLLPASVHNAFGPPKVVLPRVPHQDHEMNWIRAIKGQDTLSSPFSYAGNLHEIMLLGLVSLRARSKIDYDAANMRVTNNANANQYLTREYRAPYKAVTDGEVSMRTRYLLVAILAVVWTSARPAAEGQPPALPTLLGAAATYVAQFEARAAAFVFEEHYAQTINRSDQSSRAYTQRELRSEVVVLHAADTGWVGFRDVFEVDGKPIRDRQDRLQALFVKRSKTALSEARAIADEGARFNLGSVQRNLNYPTMALMFLRDQHQTRSGFTRERSESVNGTPTWVVGFSEKQRPSLIGSGSGDVVTTGRFWIEPDSGRVRRTQLTIKEELADVTITVVYGTWPDLDILMPVSMEERLSFRGVVAVSTGPKTKALMPVVEVMTGRARYSNPKQFTVEVDTAVKGLQ